MDWKAQIEMTGEVLDRIVVLLLTIADLAERAAAAPDARRRLVLAIIRRGDTAASGLVSASSRGFASTEPAPACAASGAGRGDTPEDAIALAMSLRTLALLLRSITGQARRLSRLLPNGVIGETNGHGGHRRHRQVARSFANAVSPSAQILDTS